MHEKLSSEKHGQPSHSGLCSFECVHFFFEINASGFWHCQVVYSLSSVLYTLEVYTGSQTLLRACSSKVISTSSCNKSVSNVHAYTHTYSFTHSCERTPARRHNCECFKCASLGFQLSQCRLHSWCLERYRSTEGICKQNWHSWLSYMTVIIVKFYILFVKHELIYMYILWG